MTIGRKTGGRDWKKGQSGNPNGRPKIPGELRKAMKMNKELVAAELTKYMGMTVKELEVAMKSKDCTAMSRIIISIVLKAIKEGDYKRLDFLFDRIVGKVKDEVLVEGDLQAQIVRGIAARNKKDADK